jgi:hypothetical protein
MFEARVVALQKQLHPLLFFVHLVPPFFLTTYYSSENAKRLHLTCKFLFMQHKALPKRQTSRAKMDRLRYCRRLPFGWIETTKKRSLDSWSISAFFVPNNALL